MTTTLEEFDQYDRAILRCCSWSPGWTERRRQEKATALLCPNAYRWHFECDDGFSFSAIAPSESGALRVLNSERPGVQAKFTSCSPAPQISRAWMIHQQDLHSRALLLRALGIDPTF